MILCGVIMSGYSQDEYKLRTVLAMPVTSSQRCLKHVEQHIPNMKIQYYEPSSEYRQKFRPVSIARQANATQGLSLARFITLVSWHFVIPLERRICPSKSLSKHTHTHTQSETHTYIHYWSGIRSQCLNDGRETEWPV
jgi:hypothetical protein